MSAELINSKKALIFRIAHRDNVAWLLANGLQCRNSRVACPNYVEIGNPELIERRRTRNVPIAPRGTLSDYVPFYFTPWSPMLYNIKTGYRGIIRRPNEEIVIFVSSLPRLKTQGVPFVFTDRHAYLATAEYYSDLADLRRIAWGPLQRRDFKRDPENPGKFERYEAEALVHGALPVEALHGIVCFDKPTSHMVQEHVTQCGLEINVLAKPDYYFR